MNIDREFFVTEIDTCMPVVIIQDVLLNVSLCLETFFNGAYLSRIKLILLRKLRKINAYLFLFNNTILIFCLIVKNKVVKVSVEVSAISFINI